MYIIKYWNIDCTFQKIPSYNQSTFGMSHPMKEQIFFSPVGERERGREEALLLGKPFVINNILNESNMLKPACPPWETKPLCANIKWVIT